MIIHSSLEQMRQLLSAKAYRREVQQNRNLKRQTAKVSLARLPLLRMRFSPRLEPSTSRVRSQALTHSTKYSHDFTDFKHHLNNYLFGCVITDQMITQTGLRYEHKDTVFLVEQINLKIRFHSHLVTQTVLTLVQKYSELKSEKTDCQGQLGTFTTFTNEVLPEARTFDLTSEISSSYPFNQVQP